MRAQAAETGDAQRMQAWAGQSVRLGRAEPAGRLVRRMWDGTLALLKEGHMEPSGPGSDET
jgi:nitronate monooxygenase